MMHHSRHVQKCIVQGIESLTHPTTTKLCRGVDEPSSSSSSSTISEGEQRQGTKSLENRGQNRRGQNRKMQPHFNSIYVLCTWMDMLVAYIFKGAFVPL
jgi:hypothetical protein